MKKASAVTEIEEAATINSALSGMDMCRNCGVWHTKGAEHACALDLTKVAATSFQLSEPLHVRVTNSDASSEIVLLPVGELYESPWNPRQYYPDAEMAELTASMRESGFRSWLPLVVRPIGESSEVWRPTDLMGGYEVGAGHRRLRAAKEAGLAHVPCVVRPMTDEQFLEVLNFDNSGRQDVHPLHEAAGWRGYMKRTGKTVAQIAAKIGKSESYVYKVLKYSDLIETAQRAFLDGAINSDHARLLCHRSPSDQAKALRACELPFDGRMMSARELKVWMAKNLDQSLAEAPFDRGALDLVPEAGSCVDCPYRLGNSPDYDPANDIADVCSNLECYQAKLAAHVERRKSEPGLVQISEYLRTDLAGVVPAMDWSETRSEVPEAKPALIVEGKRLGHEIRVLIQENSTAEPPCEVTPPAPKPKKQAAPKPTAEEQERERVRLQQLADQEERERKQAEERRIDAERKIEAEKQTRQAILRALLARITEWGKLQPADVRAALGNDIELPEEMDDAIRSIGIDPVNWQPRHTEGLSPLNFAKLVVMIAVSGDFDDFTFSRSCASLETTAKRYGVNVAKFRERAKEAEGGTRKEVVKKLPALGDDPGATNPRLAVPCPQCGAKAGQSCTNYKGQRCHPHGHRKLPKSRENVKPSSGSFAQTRPAAKPKTKKAPAPAKKASAKKGGKK